MYLSNYIHHKRRLIFSGVAFVFFISLLFFFIIISVLIENSVGKKQGNDALVERLVSMEVNTYIIENKLKNNSTDINNISAWINLELMRVESIYHYVADSYGTSSSLAVHIVRPLVRIGISFLLYVLFLCVQWYIRESLLEWVKYSLFIDKIKIEISISKK